MAVSQSSQLENSGNSLQARWGNTFTMSPNWCWMNLVHERWSSTPCITSGYTCIWTHTWIVWLRPSNILQQVHGLQPEDTSEQTEVGSTLRVFLQLYMALVGSWLFCIQQLPCLVSLQCMPGGSVEVWTKNILNWFIVGQTHFGMPRGAKWVWLSMHWNRLLFI